MSVLFSDLPLIVVCAIAALCFIPFAVVGCVELFRSIRNK